MPPRSDSRSSSYCGCAASLGRTSGNDTVNFTASGKSGIAVTLNGVSEGVFTLSGPLIVFGQGETDFVNEGSGLKNSVYLLASPTADSIEADLDTEAIPMGRPVRCRRDSQRLVCDEAFPEHCR
jgi:hypothetical protein